MVQFGYEVEDRFGYTIEYIDLGGGFPSKNKLKGTYLPPDVAISPIEEYAEKVLTVVSGVSGNEETARDLTQDIFLKMLFCYMLELQR